MYTQISRINTLNNITPTTRSQLKSILTKKLLNRYNISLKNDIQFLIPTKINH